MGSKKKPKVEKVTSPFSGVQSYNVGLEGISSGTAGKSADGKSLDVTGSLSPQLSQLNTGVQSGLLQQQDYINQTPQQKLEQLQAGGNAYYNAQNAILDKQLRGTLATQQARLSRNGLINSTAAGAQQAQVASDAALRNAILQNEAINFGQQQAIQSGGYNSALLNQLAQLQQAPASLASANLMQAENLNANVALQNAAAQNQANMAAYQNQGSLMGSILGTVGTIGGALVGGPMGASIGSALGNMGRGLFGGGSSAGASNPFSGATQSWLLGNGAQGGLFGTSPTQFVGGSL